MRNHRVGEALNEKEPVARAPGHDLDQTEWGSLTIFYWNEEPDDDAPDRWDDDCDDWPPDP